MSALPDQLGLPEVASSDELLKGLITFAPGTLIFEEDEKGAEAYLIHKGYVEISKYVDNRKDVIAVLGPGEIFGEITALDGKTRTATATALHESTLLPISRKQFYSALAGEDPLTQLLLQSVIRRLRGMHDQENSDIDDESDNFVNKDILFLETQKKAVDHVNAIAKLSKAVEKREFQLHYQPIINLASGAVNGFEVLVRGPKSLPEFFSPLSFIPIAEETGLIVPLGEWILEFGLEAFKILEQEADRRAHSEDIFISINVSPRQLDEESHVEKLVDIISRSGVAPNHVKLEITESTLLANPNAALEALNRLRAIGVEISIDDFGTGYSSLNYLNRFPLNTLKIDRSFISNLFKDENGGRIVSAILGLANNLEMKVVAEGIETKKDHDWLISQGCDYGQGYYYAKPMPIREVTHTLNKSFS